MSFKRPAMIETLLVVDDQPAELARLVSLLHDEGYRVLAATDGEAALGLATRWPPPDLALIDADMPGLDGFELLNRLHDDPSTEAVPVMIFTAAGDRAGESRALALGAVECLGKAMPTPALLMRVRRQLDAAVGRRVPERQTPEQLATAVA